MLFRSGKRPRNREVQPQPDWWLIGGRMRIGCSPQEAAARNVKRETGLDLAPGRLQFLTAVSMLWKHRKQVRPAAEV